MGPPVHISLTDLPDGTQPQMDFLDSTWFKSYGRTRAFPSPDHVRSFIRPFDHIQPIIFEELGLVVKFGTNIYTSEATTLRAMRRLFRIESRYRRFTDGGSSSGKGSPQKSSSTWNSFWDPLSIRDGHQCLSPISKVCAMI